MAIVYQHRRLDTNEVFYIGIGKDIKRAYNKHHRNKLWWNIINKYGYDVDILINGCSWEQACEVEVGLIHSYGRKDLGEGNLVNMTDGGEGNNGVLRTNEWNNNISESKKGKKKKPLSEEHKQKISEIHKGKKVSEETKQKISVKHKGRISPKKGIPRSEETKQKMKQAWIIRKQKLYI